MGITRGEPLHTQIADVLRGEIRAGDYAPGAQLPSERELRERFGVSTNTVRNAIVRLHAEGLVVSRHGRGVFVREDQPALRRLDVDITNADGFYTMLDRMGKQPATVTTVSRGPASDEVADWLDVPSGTEVVIRDRTLRAEGGPPVGIATSYFPAWVVEAAPNLGNPEISGLPRWLRDAFGPTYSEDLVDVRRATEDEARRLEIEPGSPVLIVKGTTRDQQHRMLHFIDKVTAAGRMLYGYRYGAVPADEAAG